MQMSINEVGWEQQNQHLFRELDYLNHEVLPTLRFCEMLSKCHQNGNVQYLQLAMKALIRSFSWGQNTLGDNDQL